MTDFGREDLESILESVEAIAESYGIDDDVEAVKCDNMEQLAYHIFEYSERITDNMEQDRLNSMYDAETARNSMKSLRNSLSPEGNADGYKFSSLEAMQLNSLYVVVADDLEILGEIDWKSEYQPLLTYQDGGEGRQKVNAIKDLLTGIENRINTPKTATP